MKRVTTLILTSVLAFALVGCDLIDDNKDEDIDVTEVNFEKPTLSMTVGQTETLSVTVLPNDATNKSISWSSDDEDIATVSKEGVVTAIAKGTTTITATSEADKDIYAECVITITESTGSNSKLISRIDILRTTYPSDSEEEPYNERKSSHSASYTYNDSKYITESIEKNWKTHEDLGNDDTASYGYNNTYTYSSDKVTFNFTGWDNTDPGHNYESYVTIILGDNGCATTLNDKNGNKLYDLIYDEHNQLTKLINDDEEENVLECPFTWSDGNLASIDKYSYEYSEHDNNGNFDINSIGTYGFIQIEEYYNLYNGIIGKRSAKLVSKEKYEQKGVPCENTFEYEFDDEGNVTKITVMYDDIYIGYDPDEPLIAEKLVCHIYY